MLVEFVKRKLGTGQKRMRGPRIFVVHGHDDEAITELQATLKRILKACEIVVLRDVPGEGRTVIEKFEDESDQADVALVVLTPDDVAHPRLQPEKTRPRARQNVIFELGYFYAKLQRTKGRVAVLCKGDVERPSDIAGIECIDITGGVGAAADQIKQVISDWI
jgi:predicted nucleotide-binding protein